MGLSQSANVLRSKSSLSHVQFVLPQAPLRSITASMGFVMPAWFDMFSFNLPTGNFVPGEEDEEGMMQSIASLDELLNQLVASGVEPSRIVLGGFSQGAAMSLLTGLTTTRKLAGLFALGARLPIRQKVKTMVSAHAPSVPIFWGHGAADPVVKYSLGRLSADFLVNEIGIPTAPSLGAPTGLDFHTYEGLEHSLRADELDDLALWLEKIIPPSV
ncbi:Phospholipase/carboxylesterase [Mycena rebaudengoi]|nr:Phospholipase/carboxylesterase [Mycena rebaudengoi]